MRGSIKIRRRSLQASRSGKVFTLFLLVLYLIAGIAALVYVHALILSRLPDEGIGAHQGAIVGAADRASQKLLYLEESAKLSYDAATRLLYEDQYGFFTSSEGDTVTQPGCGAYAYRLWNTETERCDETLATELPPALERQTLALLGGHAAAYPRGGFSVPYTLAVAQPYAEPLTLSLRGGELEEPIMLGLYSGESPAAAARAFAGTDTLSALSWPSSGSQTITSCFGPRLGVAAATSDVHTGMDIAPGGEVLAAADGVVMNDPFASQYGTVWIKHSESLSSAYLHLDKASIRVRQGESVKRMQPIGVASDTGCAASGCTPHLHFEVLVGGPPSGGGHAYSRGYAPGWTAINPACLFEEISDGQISPSATQSCLDPGYPTPATKAYCAEYGLSLEPSTSPTSEKPGATRPSESMPTLDPTVGIGSQRKLAQTYTNMARYDWGQHVIAASATYGIPQSLLLAIITQESQGDPLAIGNGDVGLMQINDATANLPQVIARTPLAGATTPCSCANTRAGPGSGCACTAENDRRLLPAYAIPAAAWLLNDDRVRNNFDSYPDRLELMAASYNTGGPNVVAAIRATGKDQPSWEEVAKELRSGDIISKENGQAVTDYVAAVMAYAQAWNGGVPPDAGREERLAPFVGLRQVGTYSFDPSMTLRVEDRLTPFLALAERMRGILDGCASDEIPGKCLLDEAAQSDPAIAQATAKPEEGLGACEEDPRIRYAVALYEALRDCAENGQYACQCPLPAPPQDLGPFTLAFDKQSGSAVLTVDGVGVERLHLLDITSSAFRVGDGLGAVPERLSLDETGGMAYQLPGSDDEGRFDPGWSVEKGELFLDQLLFRASKSEEAELCAPVKRRYALCSAIAEGMPPARFAVTLQDDRVPEAVTALLYDATKKSVTFTASSAKDISFYNVYDQSLSSSTVPVLQLRGQPSEGKLSFDASAYAGKTLYVTPVDRAGNEGTAIGVAIPASP